METTVQRFLRYVNFPTTSDENSQSCPSTPGQLVLGEALVKEMQEMGIADARMDGHGYVYGTVPGDPKAPVIGLIAHMDTSDAASGENIKARTVLYEGKDILLNEEKGIYLRAEDFPGLEKHKGKHLIVTDGTTLLGADDKAGIAAILSCAERLLRSRDHATLKIGFTPDEEIGRGADLFDVKGFGADYAFTVDGDEIGVLEYENFNAAAATVTFTGKSFHPGSSKGKMVNSQLVAMEYNAMLPVFDRPEHTEGYEGFIHLTDMVGDVEKSVLSYIIRDHDITRLRRYQAVMEDAADYLNRKYGDGTVSVTIKDSYRNMKEQLADCTYIIDRAVKAIEAAGLEAGISAIRGGTDGARLCEMGLPCPNLGTGGGNYHGRFEYVVTEDMEKNVDILEQILKTY